jgi:REP element-mobilizing transposase RayT
MGYPRHLYVPPGIPGIYHCVSRCVRRAFLCGKDPLTGRSFEHRKQWVEDRILTLAQSFAIAVHAYAVMSNHFHVVLETDPAVAQAWSDEETARRWLALSTSTAVTESALGARLAALLAQPERLAVLRERLGNLSWFMRYLNEPIARRANREDDCTGRFWEGRFACQALLDDAAVLGCMVYVDLNPVRAGLVATPEAGLHTSVRRRARTPQSPLRPLLPLASSIRSQLPSVTTEQYLALVDWTGRTLHPGHRGAAPTDAPPLLARLGLRPRQWLIQVPATESHYWRAIGGTEALLARAHSTGLKWLRGIGMARALARAGSLT